MSKLPIKDRILGNYALLKRKAINYWRRLSSKNVLAVYDDELDDILKNLGLDEKIQKGSINCQKCGCTITRNNLGVIKKENGAIQIFCLTTSCNSNND